MYSHTYSSQYADEPRDRQPSIVQSLQNYSDYYLSTDFSVTNKDLGILTQYARYVICFWLIKISTPIAHILHALVLDEYMIRRLQVLSATRLYIFLMVYKIYEIYKATLTAQKTVYRLSLQ